MDSELITRWLTCHTLGCGNSEIAIRAQYPKDVDVLFCGVCSAEITDVATMPTEPVTEMPTWV